MTYSFFQRPCPLDHMKPLRARDIRQVLKSDCYGLWPVRCGADGRKVIGIRMGQDRTFEIRTVGKAAHIACLGVKDLILELNSIPDDFEARLDHGTDMVEGIRVGHDEAVFMTRKDTDYQCEDRFIMNEPASPASQSTASPKAASRGWNMWI